MELTTIFVLQMLVLVTQPSGDKVMQWVDAPAIGSPYNARVDCNKERARKHDQFQGLVDFRCKKKDKENE